MTVTIKSMSLKQALDKCFEGHPLQYEIIDKTIVTKPKSSGRTVKVKGISKKIPITGKLTDESGKALSGVSKRVKGSDLKTSSNEQGAFAIDVLTLEPYFIFHSWVINSLKEQ